MPLGAKWASCVLERNVLTESINKVKSSREALKYLMLNLPPSIS